MFALMALIFIKQVTQVCCLTPTPRREFVPASEVIILSNLRHEQCAEGAGRTAPVVNPYLFEIIHSVEAGPGETVQNVENDEKIYQMQDLKDGRRRNIWNNLHPEIQFSITGRASRQFI